MAEEEQEVSEESSEESEGSEEEESQEEEEKQESRPRASAPAPRRGRQVKTQGDRRFISFFISVAILTGFWLYDTGRLSWLVAIWTSDPNAYVSPGEVAAQPVHHCDFFCQLGNAFQQAAQDYAASQGASA